MNRFLEILLGLHRGFLSREGELSIQFNPQWPGQHLVGAGVWNFLLAALAAMLVIYVYRRDGRSRALRITLGVIRAALVLLVILLLNRPVLTLGQSRTEPSVLAVMLDDSISMRVRDAASGEKDQPGRLAAAENLLIDHDGEMLKTLARKHNIRLYRFDRDAQPVGTVEMQTSNLKSTADVAPAIASLEKISPQGQSTQVLPSILTVLQDLQGQRVAGVVVLTDGRDTPSRSLGNSLDLLKNYGVKVYPVAVGSDQQPRNIEMQSMTAEDTAFKGDIVNVKATVRGTGFERNHPVTIVLKDKKSGAQLPGIDGSSAEKTINLPDDKPVDVELQWKTTEIGPKDIVVEAVKQPGELDDDDNARSAQVSVLDAKIAVLYVEGYPRWEYRYLKNEMVRDKTVDISCLLASADAGFAQEGDKPIRRFPESIEELMDYDVVVFGDVDPRFLTDTQLQLVGEFVSRKGGGFAMIAGPRWSPASFRNTAIEPLLPVAISRVEPSDFNATITQGFRPVLTQVGSASSIFRFFADRQQNENFIKNDIQSIFWYCRGVTPKPGVGEVYAEHPSDVGPDGRKSPILVLGRFGAGRTLFSAIDDSWRWRFYTGESVFDTYWVQQLRYLARSRKIGQRKVSLSAGRQVYELGGQVRISLRVLDPVLLQQLPEQIRVEIRDGNGQPVRFENLLRQEGQNDLYTGSFTADRVGKFTIEMPPIAGGVDMMEAPVEVSLPRLELADPQVDRTQLSRLASETLGKSIDFDKARAELPLIPSAAKVIPVISGQPLWDAPLTMALFVLLIATEWIVRKLYGMV